MQECELTDGCVWVGRWAQILCKDWCVPTKYWYLVIPSKWDEMNWVEKFYFSLYYWEVFKFWGTYVTSGLYFERLKYFKGLTWKCLPFSQVNFGHFCVLKSSYILNLLHPWDFPGVHTSISCFDYQKVISIKVCFTVWLNSIDICVQYFNPVLINNIGIFQLSPSTDYVLPNSVKIL